jgi:acyl-CoA thioesterase-2
MQVASLDHVMWFHEPFRVDEWLLHVMHSPAAHGARGLVFGRVFTREGRLVASIAQEGLIRKR